MNILHSYQNGNTKVTLYEDGTKVREYDGIPQPEFPESIDIKITDFCDMGCHYCHENSTIRGKAADAAILYEKLKDLPSGVELAIGGGNPLTHPYLGAFLDNIKRKGSIANLTINQKHILPFKERIQLIISNKLAYGIGVSITDIENFEPVNDLKKLSKNIVYHVICGKDKVETLDTILSHDSTAKILILGFKQYGRGITYYSEEIEQEIKRWKMYLPKYFGKALISFDNLAIEQLYVRRFFTDKGWDKFYMGDDFTFSMYIDAVKKEYAPTSRSSERRSWNRLSVRDYFQKFRIQTKN